MESTRTEYVICEHNDDYGASLEVGKTYRTLPDPKAAEHGFLRVVDESGEDYLYPQGWFAPVPRHYRRPWRWVSRASALYLLWRRVREKARQ